jgi:single-strand DNA-binding protein
MIRKRSFFPGEKSNFASKTITKKRFSTFYKQDQGRYDRAIKPKGVKKMINQVIIVGRLTRDPELKMTTDGTPVAHVTLAVNRHFRNHNGEIEADFIQCTIWRKAAENTVQYCRKGSILGITGRIQTRHYDNQEGRRVYATEVITDTVRFLSSKPPTEAKDQKLEEVLPF